MINVSLEDKVKDLAKRLEFGSKISLMLFIAFVIVFLAVWASIKFVLPSFLTDVKLVEKAGLFALWTIGAILFGAALATFFIGRKLGSVARGK
mgnify:CR=1 FL=1